MSSDRYLRPLSVCERSQSHRKSVININLGGDYPRCDIRWKVKTIYGKSEMSVAFYVAGWVGGLGYPFPRIFGIDYYYLNTYSIDDSFDFYCMYVILDYYTVPII